MCTAISFVSHNHYFGRNLDLNYDLPLNVLAVPRNYPISFKATEERKRHYAIYGIGRIKDNYPFFFDCVNEKGLTFAGLNFPGFAYFGEKKTDKLNLAPYELPLYLLGHYQRVKEVKKALEGIYLANLPFSKDLPVATLHFIRADKEDCIVIEQTKEGRKVYDNPYRVLTNNPPFPYHQFNINNYRNLTNQEPINRFSSALPLSAYGKARGAIGLPGDSSPSSRFIKESFLLQNTVKYGTEGKERTKEEEEKNISTAFHLLNSVSTLIGESQRKDKSYEYTIYSSIYSIDKNELFVKTYFNSSLQRFKLNKTDLESASLISYPLSEKESYQEIN